MRFEASRMRSVKAIREALCVATLGAPCSVDGMDLASSELARSLVTAVQSRALQPHLLFDGVLASLRSEGGAAAPRMVTALAVMDDAFAAATGFVAGLLGGGTAGGFTVKLRASLRGAALLGDGAAPASAVALAGLLRADCALPAGRALLLDVLLRAGENHDAVARQVLATWPQLLPEPPQRDALAAAVAAVLDGGRSAWEAAAHAALTLLQNATRGEGGSSAMHCAVRALDLLVCRCDADAGARWVEAAMLPPLLPLLACVASEPVAAAAACRALAPVLRSLPSEGGIAVARRQLFSALPGGRLDPVTAAAAEACAELCCRSRLADASERDLLQRWWLS